MIAASLSIILGAALVGAMADGAAAASPVRTAQTSSVSEVYARYNDNEITALLVAGQGRAAREHPGVLVFGLCLSILLMGVAARFIANLLNKYRWIAYIGLAVILYVAIGMVYRGAEELRPIVVSLAGLN